MFQHIGFNPQAGVAAQLALEPAEGPHGEGVNVSKRVSRGGEGGKRRGGWGVLTSALATGHPAQEVEEAQVILCEDCTPVSAGCTCTKPNPRAPGTSAPPTCSSAPTHLLF
jgi:hypothetical protein